MSVNYKTGDKIILNETVGDLPEGTTATIKYVKGCSCKLDAQWAIVEVNGVKHEIKNFRSKVSLVNGL